MDRPTIEMGRVVVDTCRATVLTGFVTATSTSQARNIITTGRNINTTGPSHRQGSVHTP